MAKYKYDAFTSYKWKEPVQSWVRGRLVPALEAEGLTICIDYRDFPLGALIIPEMERAVITSRYTLAIMTPEYVSSNFGQLERIMAQQLGMEQSQRRLIAGMRENCTPPLSMRVHIWLDMTDDAEFTQQIKRLANELQKPNSS